MMKTIKTILPGSLEHVKLERIRGKREEMDGRMKEKTGWMEWSAEINGIKILNHENQKI